MDRHDALVRIVDDDATHCDALRFLLMTEGWESRVWTSALEFLREEDGERPGGVILDYQMPEVSGVELQEMLLERGVALPVLFLTAHADLDMAIRIFKKGANDLLKKPVSPDALVEAVRGAVEKDFERRAKLSPSLTSAALFESLTLRERQVLLLASRGLRNGQIASRLSLSERTVETHRANGYRRLAVKNLQELQQFLLTVPEATKKG